MFGSGQRVDYTGYDFRFQMEVSATSSACALCFVLAANFARASGSWPRKLRSFLYSFGHILAFVVLIGFADTWLEAAAVGLCVGMLANIVVVLVVPFVSRQIRTLAGAFALLAMLLLLAEVMG